MSFYASGRPFLPLHRANDHMSSSHLLPLGVYLFTTFPQGLLCLRYQCGSIFSHSQHTEPIYQDTRLTVFLLGSWAEDLCPPEAIKNKLREMYQYNWGRSSRSLPVPDPERTISIPWWTATAAVQPYNLMDLIISVHNGQFQTHNYLVSCGQGRKMLLGLLRTPRPVFPNVGNWLLQKGMALF